MWGRIGKLLRREGADPSVSTKFYRAVVQVVLLFGAETWMLSAPMAKKLEGVHMGFLRQVTRLKAKRLKDGSWQKVASDRVLQGAGTQPLQTYIGRRQATVAEWVALRPIFEVYAKETGYEGGGRLREPWWRQAAAEKQLRATLEDILVAAMEWRRQEPSRRGGGEGVEEESDSESNG